MSDNNSDARKRRKNPRDEKNRDMKRKRNKINGNGKQKQAKKKSTRVEKILSALSGLSYNEVCELNEEVEEIMEEE